jgi:hypothetical protein
MVDHWPEVVTLLFGAKKSTVTFSASTKEGMSIRSESGNPSHVGAFKNLETIGEKKS